MDRCNKPGRVAADVEDSQSSDMIGVRKDRAERGKRGDRTGSEGTVPMGQAGPCFRMLVYKLVQSFAGYNMHGSRSFPV